jgi:PKD repeat protein
MVRISKQLVEKALFSLCVFLSVQYSLTAQCNADYTFTVDSVQGIVNCTNTSTLVSIDSPTVYTWYETPGNVLSNSVNPIFSFSDGPHTLCLMLDNAGCSDTICATITIPPRYCRARYSYSVNNTTGVVSFTNQSIGDQNSYIWSFDDGGALSTDTNPVHTYESGWYYVCLNIQNADSSCKDVACNYIRIQKPTPTPCVADFSYAYDTLNSKIVHFSNETFSDSSISVIWLFPGDQKDTIHNPSFDFQFTGNYTVCLLVSGPLCADSICKTVEVIEILPVCEAVFSYKLFADTVNGGAPRIAVFDNQSGNNVTYEWWMNDSLVSVVKDPVYYFADNGTYKVCLVVKNQQFCTDSTCELINIQSVPLAIREETQRCPVKLSPNPAETTVSIDLDDCMEPIEYIRIYNMLGTTEYIRYSTGSPVIIPLENLNKGLYIVEVKTTHFLIRKKLNKR